MFQKATLCQLLVTNRHVGIIDLEVGALGTSETPLTISYLTRNKTSEDTKLRQTNPVSLPFQSFTFCTGLQMQDHLFRKFVTSLNQVRAEGKVIYICHLSVCLSVQFFAPRGISLKTHRLRSAAEKEKKKFSMNELCCQTSV